MPLGLEQELHQLLRRLWKTAISAILSPRNICEIRARLTLAWVFQNLSIITANPYVSRQRKLSQRRHQK